MIIKPEVLTELNDKSSYYAFRNVLFRDPYSHQRQQRLWLRKWRGLF